MFWTTSSRKPKWRDTESTATSGSSCKRPDFKGTLESRNRELDGREPKQKAEICGNENGNGMGTYGKVIFPGYGRMLWKVNELQRHHQSNFSSTLEKVGVLEYSRNVTQKVYL